MMSLVLLTYHTYHFNEFVSDFPSRFPKEVVFTGPYLTMNEALCFSAEEYMFSS